MINNFDKSSIKVVINKYVHINVIGNVSPEGICGSAIIDASAQMLNAGLVDSCGRILRGRELPDALPAGILNKPGSESGQRVFILSGEDNHKFVYITQKDIRELQITKPAIYSGIRILKRKLGVKLEDIEEVLIAGAFGNFIKRSNAKRIDLIPAVDSNKIKFIGNASSSGAKLLLLSKEMEKEAGRIADMAEHVELASREYFHTEFSENILFPPVKILSARKQGRS